MKSMLNASNCVRMLCTLLLFLVTSSAFAGEVVVQKGDTLSRIALANKVAGGWVKLWEENKNVVKNPNLIFPGQRIWISKSEAIASRKEKVIAPILKQKIEKTTTLEVVVPVNSFEKVSVAPVAKFMPQAATTAMRLKLDDAIATPVAVAPLSQVDVAPVVKQEQPADVVRAAQVSMNNTQGPPPKAEPPVILINEPSPKKVVAVNSDVMVNTVAKATAPTTTTSLVDEFKDPKNFRILFGPGAALPQKDRPEKAKDEAKDEAKSKPTWREEVNDPSLWRSIPKAQNLYLPPSVQAQQNKQ